MATRRKFLNNLLNGSLGAGAFSAFSFAAKDKHYKYGSDNLPVYNEVDICVLGGSCTGVFAAIRAARLGARVAIVEKQNAFGGVATNALVLIWHSLFDEIFEKQIIAGLTMETMERLLKRDAVVKNKNNPSSGFVFNPQELKIELDELVLESGIFPYLHTLFSEPYLDKNGKLTGVIVDNKSGRGIIKAANFIDATGDADLCHRLGIDTYSYDLLQPPTTCALFEGWDHKEFNSLLTQHREEFDIPEGFVWGNTVPSTDIFMLAGTRVFGVNCANADDLTKAEMEGRRQIRAFTDMMRKYGSPKEHFGLVNLASQIGIRETRHVDCLHKVTDDDALHGKRYEDAIANGSYRFDIHHQGKPGLTFRYLDGREIYVRPGHQSTPGRWREETDTNPTFYQVPLRSLIPEKIDNLMVAGRMFDAEMIAFSGIRVMVNMNQLGEAAGVTSFLALDQDKAVKDVDHLDVRKTLERGGSIVL